jgi:hypothetical protein
MGISIKTDLEWGQSFYIKTDPIQIERQLTGVTLRPGKGVVFSLSYMGEELDVYDFEVTPEPDKLKQIENKEPPEED